MAFLLFLAVLSLLVLFHELGHYLTARLFGVRVDEFGFGFPPRLWSYKKGQTDYSINWIPLGGFVKIKGETGEHKGDHDSFASKPGWQKAIVLVAGVAMNFFLAFLLFWIGFVAGFPSAVEGLPGDAKIRDRAVTVQHVLENSPAAGVKMQAGDAIVAVNGVPILTYEEFKKRVLSDAPKTITLTLKAKGATREVTAETALIKESGKYGFGVALMETGVVSFSPMRAIGEAARVTYNATAAVLKGFGELLWNLATKGKLAAEVSGPVGIAVITGEVARLGLTHLIQFAALLSINLGVLNVIPFPALDGGRLLFVALERFRGRALATRIETYIHGVGFILLMLLVVFVTYRDLGRYGSGILAGIAGMLR